MDSLEVTDAASAAVQKTPNRVSLDSMKAKIAAEYTFNLGELVEMDGLPVHDSLKVMTLSVLVMENGFTVIGKSAPADAANFNQELGSQFAREDAIRQLWPLEGYALREKLHGERT